MWKALNTQRMKQLKSLSQSRPTHKTHRNEPSEKFPKLNFKYGIWLHFIRHKLQSDKSNYEKCLRWRNQFSFLCFCLTWTWILLQHRQSVRGKMKNFNCVEPLARWPATLSTIHRCFARINAFEDVSVSRGLCVIWSLEVVFHLKHVQVRKV